MFRRYAQEHIHVIRHQVPFFRPAFLLTGQLVKYVPQMATQHSIQRLAATLRNETPSGICIPTWCDSNFDSPFALSFRVGFERLSPKRRNKRLPELSNSGSLPGRAGGLPELVNAYPKRRLRGSSLRILLTPTLRQSRDKQVLVSSAVEVRLFIKFRRAPC